jgi:hypothetical protein
MDAGNGLTVNIYLPPQRKSGTSRRPLRQQNNGSEFTGQPAFAIAAGSFFAAFEHPSNATTAKMALYTSILV